MLPALWNTPALAPLSHGSINRLDSFFDRVFGEDGMIGQAWNQVPVAAWEDEEHIYVEAELPGMTEQDVEVTVHNGTLLIRGERKPTEARKYLYNGRFFGRFERVINLPEAVCTDDVQAKLTDGVLAIALPKRPEAKPKRVAIQTR